MIKILSILSKIYDTIKLSMGRVNTLRVLTTKTLPPYHAFYTMRLRLKTIKITLGKDTASLSLYIVGTRMPSGYNNKT